MSTPTSPNLTNVNLRDDPFGLIHGDNFASRVDRYPAWRRQASPPFGLSARERAEYEQRKAASTSQRLAREAPVPVLDNARVTALPQSPATTEAGEPTAKNEPVDTFRPWNLPHETGPKGRKKTRFGGLFEGHGAYTEKTPSGTTGPGSSRRRDNTPLVHSSPRLGPVESSAFYTQIFGPEELRFDRPTRFGDTLSARQDQGYQRASGLLGPDDSLFNPPTWFRDTRPAQQDQGHQRTRGLFGNTGAGRSSEAWYGLDRDHLCCPNDERIQNNIEETTGSFGRLFHNIHDTAPVPAPGHKRNPSGGAELSCDADASINIHMDGDRVTVKVEDPEASTKDAGVINLFGDQHTTNVPLIKIHPPEYEELSTSHDSKKGPKSITLTITFS